MDSRTALTKDAARRDPAELMFAPLGLDLRIELESANHAALVGSACRSWGGKADDIAMPLRLRVASSPDLNGFGEARIRVAGQQLHIAGPGLEGGACADARRGWCKVSASYLAEPQRLREDAIEPLALWLITHNGRTPLHAAGILAGDCAILLTGPSGSGKSSLAVAADRAGLQVLSDDTVYLQRGPEPKVWGWPGPAHILPEDLRGLLGPIRVRNGRLKHAVPLRSSTRSGTNAVKATVVILQHGGRPALCRIGPEDAMRRLAHLEPGFELLRTDVEAAHRLLTRKGAWLLILSKDPAEAIAVLRENLDALRAAAIS